jgi:membrane protease YdiL (CAAX protease family)
MQVALALVTLRWARRSGFQVVPLLRLARPPPRSLLAGIGVGVAAMLAGSGVHALTRAALPERLVRSFDVGQALLDAGWSRAALVAVVSLLPALCEELAFRGGLLSALLGRGSPARAIALSALAFAVFHLDPVRLPAVLLLGMAFGWLAWRTGSLWPSALAHALNNGAAVAGLLLVERPGPSEPAEALASGEAAVLAASGAALFWLVAVTARRWLPPAPEAATFLRPVAPAAGAAGPPPPTTGGAAPWP